MRIQSASTVRSEAFRSSVFSFENIISMGLKSGDLATYGEDGE